MADLVQVTFWVGLDVAKESHFAVVLNDDGERLLAPLVPNDQTSAPARAADRPSSLFGPTL